MEKNEMIPMEDAWNCGTAFYIYYRDEKGKKELFFMIQKGNRKEFEEKFKRISKLVLDSTVPGIFPLIELCKEYGSIMSKERFEKLSTHIMGISTRDLKDTENIITGYRGETMK